MHSNSGARRHHSAKLKAQVLAACNEAGASISGVALAHGPEFVAIEMPAAPKTTANTAAGRVGLTGFAADRSKRLRLCCTAILPVHGMNTPATPP